jgi:CheY-like chemotaxis protein
LRILLVEDNLDIVELLTTILRFDGHSVEVATSGFDVLPIALRCRPHVVLCDLGLPGKDGFVVASELRAAPETAGAHLIAISGYGTAEHKRRSERAGFDLHLTKPLDCVALLSLIGTLPAAAADVGR